MPISTQTLTDLAKYDTPTICNVIELFDVRPRNVGFMDGRIQCCFPKFPPMVGFASTATFRSFQQPRKADVYASLSEQAERFAELPGPPVVVFQDLDDPAFSATFGEVMCSIYKGFGGRGIITSGAGRDLDQVEAIGFPAFTNGTICSHGYCHTMQLHVPVKVGGIMVEPGDLLHGDRNGVTTIPIEIASEIPDASREFMEGEAFVLEYVRRPNPNPKGLEEARKACAAKFAEISKRVSRKK
jgi:4-hydroxy-4-methyl-2-oxoglutarate aldolase